MGIIGTVLLVLGLIATIGLVALLFAATPEPSSVDFSTNSGSDI